ncbi:hypothetical protein KFL_006060070 [Klebsormidium nitens]|uniref:Cilia- and flagella-associated protein 157 n=1 Tax=Klebsormidium nitens TaxID=105231 RepID=A0A1Y1IH00_KLENI|nr:hypothetical protein KFL_006060070 [Klebsormidium nitens]|eukprot:GAQ90154.1 hypothetical protein KFL_006060070 [Klebsormidium nitens]
MGPKQDVAETSDDEKEEVGEEEEEAEGEGALEDDGDAESEGDPDSRLKRRLLSAQAKERLTALSERCRLLTAENEKLTEEVTEARSSLHDISEVLTAEVAAKTAAVAALERQLAEALRDAERTRGALERELAEERTTAKQHIADLTTRTEDAERQLREVRDFAERKGHLDEQLAAARAELVRQHKEHEDALCSLERHTVQDKDALRKEAAAKLKEAKAAMMALTESQLDTVSPRRQRDSAAHPAQRRQAAGERALGACPDMPPASAECQCLTEGAAAEHAAWHPAQATRATIAENEALATELRYTAKRAEKLLQQSEKLAAENAALKRDLDLSNTLAAEVARKQCLSAKAVALLTARVAGQHEAHREVDQECADLRAQARALAAHRNALEDQLAAAQQDAARLRGVAEAQAAELAAAAAHEDEALHFLRACLADVREQIVAVTAPPAGGPDSTGPAVVQGGLDELAPHQRQHALEYLFRKLAAYQAVKRGAASLAPAVQYSFASARFAGLGSPIATLQSDPSISELLALSAPLSPVKGDAVSPHGPGTKPPPPPEMASQPQCGVGAMGRSPPGAERDRSSLKGGGRLAGPGRANGPRAPRIGGSRLKDT